MARIISLIDDEDAAILVLRGSLPTRIHETGGVLETRRIEILARFAETEAGSDALLRQKRRDAVRNVLRHGGFKPSGRSKPAQEYLERCAREGSFPSINALVDVNNLASLECGYPSSILDAEVCSEELQIRYGGEGERYVFNASGHEIDLQGLLLIANPDRALGNPVKDSMVAKLREDSRDLLVVVYAECVTASSSELHAIAARYAALLEECSGVKVGAVEVLGLVSGAVVGI